MFSPPAMAAWDELVGDAGTYASAHAVIRTRKRRGTMRGAKKVLAKSETKSKGESGTLQDYTCYTDYYIVPFTQSSLIAPQYYHLPYGRILVFRVRMSAQQLPAAFDLHKV